MIDDLENLLTPKQDPPTSQNYFEATATVLVQRARVRRVVRGSVWLSSIVIAGFIGWYAKPETQTVIERSVAVVPPTATMVAQEVMTADQLEMKAELSDDAVQIAKFYEQAGDVYLKQKVYEQAERCYRLSVASSRNRTPTTDDNWLLYTVKLSAPKNNTFQEKQ